MSEFRTNSLILMLVLQMVVPFAMSETYGYTCEAHGKYCFGPTSCATPAENPNGGILYSSPVTDANALCNGCFPSCCQGNCAGGITGSVGDALSRESEIKIVRELLSQRIKETKPKGTLIELQPADCNQQCAQTCLNQDYQCVAGCESWPYPAVCYASCNCILGMCSFACNCGPKPQPCT